MLYSLLVVIVSVDDKEEEEEGKGMVAIKCDLASIQYYFFRSQLPPVETV